MNIEIVVESIAIDVVTRDGSGLVLIAAKEFKFLDVGVVAIFVECADGLEGIAPVFTRFWFWGGDDGFGIAGHRWEGRSENGQCGCCGKFDGVGHNGGFIGMAVDCCHPLKWVGG